ncbi:transcriptional regulator, TetR family [Sulfurimonas gotlandica GD1]|uniref:Transcriptional regulator, TetR family n=1 Tax=Sulfurimonas gotlandica (strain DSM 19862 / JCM 16533 / GD1) TaxID=929558 RepID=B6BK90_SULGG|nr:TetR/AcrR family transcriptional regulator [Sulfurimonas gotlandica]EDZ62558.1 transcriptional regulator, TetR family [Sulfurimonas gotlandica GD1]EHP31184.1 transcriptional regulator, TetR family [Sulfurimonas gotlandica GD1]
MPENTTPHKRTGTKQKILKVSTALFSELGYKGTSVRKIAKEVGIRESAIYNHYKNKEEIFLEVAKGIFSSPFSQGNTDIKESAMKGKAFLQNFTMQYKLLTFDKSNENMFRLLMIELFQNKELREQFMSEFHDKNVKILSEAFFIMMQNSLIRSQDPMMMSYEFLSTLFYMRLQITLMRFDNDSTTAISTQFEKHVEFFWESVRI